jgi:hypothetical protein
MNQEYKSEYGIRDHVLFTVRGETKEQDVDYSGIIVAVKFTYANNFFTIVDDVNLKKHKKIPITDIVGRICVENEFLVDKRIPNEVEQFNNLYSEKIGCYGKIIKVTPKSVLMTKEESDDMVAEQLNLKKGKDY